MMLFFETKNYFLKFKRGMKMEKREEEKAYSIERLTSEVCERVRSGVSEECVSEIVKD